jgi:hypothetical protein
MLSKVKGALMNRHLDSLGRGALVAPAQAAFGVDGLCTRVWNPVNECRLIVRTQFASLNSIPIINIIYLCCWPSPQITGVTVGPKLRKSTTSILPR